MAASTNYGFKRIADPVHGTVGMSELEIALLSTQSLQRLRHVTQLGLAPLVYPAANYSRLSHCIGVNHVTGRILDALKTYSQANLPDSEYQRYRLAGLLHDVGHYPFSHAFEEAVQDYYGDLSRSHLLTSPAGAEQGEQSNSIASQTKSINPFDHEETGQYLLEHDEEITSVLNAFDIEPSSVYSVFTRDTDSSGTMPLFANLISSDLDADRMDYLLRTARHTGLPYGSVDIDYLLSQMRVDDKDRICLENGALRTVEHLLIGRYFDYQQVNYHKTVAALELVLKDVIKALLERNAFDCSQQGIEDMVASGEWYHFDDMEIWRQIRALEREDIPETLKAKVQSITRRNPPKLIGSLEFLGDRDKHSEYLSDQRLLIRLCEDLAEELSIDHALWYVWGNRPMSFTKVGAHVPVSTTLVDPDALGQSVRIKSGTGSTPIVEIPRSLMSVLAQNALYANRMYVLLPEGSEETRAKILSRVREDVTLVNWVDG